MPHRVRPLAVDESILQQYCLPSHSDSGTQPLRGNIPTVVPHRDPVCVNAIKAEFDHGHCSLGGEALSLKMFAHDDIKSWLQA